MNKLIHYWRNIRIVGVPFDTDDFPYIKKFDMLYRLDNVCTIHPNIHQFITSNTIPKIYPNISLKSIWTDEFSIEKAFENYMKFGYYPMSKHSRVLFHENRCSGA